MSTEQQARFSGWAIVEIMGHNKEIGFVTTEYFGGPALFRIDQPELPEREYTLKRAQWIDRNLCPVGTVVKREALQGKTAYVGPPAIFRITPCTEETAKLAIEEMIPVPIKILSVPEGQKLVPASTPSRYDDDDEDMERAY